MIWKAAWPSLCIAVVLAGAIWVPGMGSGKETGSPCSDCPGITDHHLHIRSPALADLMSRREPDRDPYPAVGAREVIRELDRAGIERGILLSGAYIFGTPRLELEDEYERVKAENDYNGEEAGAFPERLYAFCGVNPLAEYALTELRRCASDPRFHGMKMHFQNSHVDLRDDDHKGKLSRFFEEANGLELPLVIHLQAAPTLELTRELTEMFLTELLSRAPDIPIQIADMGGPGAFYASSNASLQVFLEAIRTEDPSARNVVFDVGAVFRDPSEFAGQDSVRVGQLQEANLLAARRILELGPGRVVFGSDWAGGTSSVPSVDGYVELSRRWIPHEGAFEAFMTICLPLRSECEVGEFDIPGNSGVSERMPFSGPSSLRSGQDHYDLVRQVGSKGHLHGSGPPFQ